MKKTIITCDRCGAVIEQDTEDLLFVIELSKNPYHCGAEHKRHELCRQCAKDYVEWVERKTE